MTMASHAGNRCPEAGLDLCLAGCRRHGASADSSHLRRALGARREVPELLEYCARSGAVHPETKDSTEPEQLVLARTDMEASPSSSLQQTSNTI